MRSFAGLGDRILPIGKVLLLSGESASPECVSSRVADVRGSCGRRVVALREDIDDEAFVSEPAENDGARNKSPAADFFQRRFLGT